MNKPLTVADVKAITVPADAPSKAIGAAGVVNRLTSAFDDTARASGPWY